MLDPSVLNYILGFIALMSAVFAIWNAVRKPTEELETKQVITGKDLENKATLLLAKEAEGKALLLAQQVALQKEAYDKKFNEISARLDTIDNKINTISTDSGLWHLEISKLLVKLETKIDERLPGKVG